MTSLASAQPQQQVHPVRRARRAHLLLAARVTSGAGTRAEQLRPFISKTKSEAAGSQQLKAMFGDKRLNVLFVGYQAKGTPGQVIQQHGPKKGYVYLDGERIQIQAGIDNIGGYTAHADQHGLLNFASGMCKPPQHMRIVYGEPQAKRQLAKALHSSFAEKGMAVDIWVSGEQQ